MSNRGTEENKIRKPVPGKTLGKGDAFWADGDYDNLRARATTKEDVGLGNVPDNIVALVEEKEELINESIASLVEAVTPLKDERDGRMVERPNLLPQPAMVTIPYGVDDEFIITAVDPSEAGNGIVIEFVNTGEPNEPLSVDLVEGKIVVSHQTNGSGETVTGAGSLETVINEHEDVSQLIAARMGGAGDVDFEGEVETEGQMPGIECKAGHIFSDGEFLFIALNDVDGVENKTTDFKKVALSDIV